MRRSVLITGGSRGIGRATALCAARSGWDVAVSYREQAAAAEGLLQEVRELGGRPVGLQGDVAVEQDVLRIFGQAADAFGGLDGVVVNAGIVAPAMPLVEMSAERLQRMFSVNVLGAALCAREAARHLATTRGGRGGSIVNVSSAAARLGAPNEYVDYAASKGALDTMTIGLAKELGPAGIRVNAVRPAYIETEIHASGGQPDRARVLGAQTPLGRPGSAEEVAEAIVWLLSPASSYVTGALIDMAGGR